MKTFYGKIDVKNSGMGVTLGSYLISPAIRRIDSALRRQQGIFEFTSDRRCLFRLSFHRFQEPHEWPDGLRVPAGVLMGELHMWNEHFAEVRVAPDLGSAVEFRRRLFYTLGALADWAARDSLGQQLPGFFADAWMARNKHLRGIEHGLVRWGFRIDQRELQFHFWNALYARLLASCFNPATKPGPVRPIRIWMSRAELLQSYGKKVLR